MPVTSLRTVLGYAAGVAAIGIVAATCSDLTGPTGLAPNAGGLVTVTYKGPPARGLGTTGIRTKAGRVVWFSADPAVVTVDSLGVAKLDSSNKTAVTTVGNGTTNVGAIFYGVDTVLTQVTVRQVTKKFQLSSRFPAGAKIALNSINETVAVTATPLDSLGKALQAGSA